MHPTTRTAFLPRCLWIFCCALTLTPTLWSQTAEVPPVPTQAEVEAKRKAKAAERSEKALELSPFTVTADKDSGYYAENTLAGSRLNTKLSDLGASITVVTKQQMEDTGSIDLNDVLRYEANTEGSSTYTPVVQAGRADGLVDTISGQTQGGDGIPLTNATANRIRGLGIPSSAVNYYPSIGSIPVDAYNIQSIEISRGPNSLLFGLGSPSGVINQSTAQAGLNKNTGRVTLRGDDRGSRRGTLAFNFAAIPSVLGLYGAFLDSDTQFIRKPSYDRTKREYAAITFHPFRKTVIRANFENYENHNNRPNSLTPIDVVSQWRQAGEPVYDPTTLMVTKLLTGQKIGPFVQQSTSPLLAQTRSYIASLPGYNPALWNAGQTTYNGINIFGTGAINNPASPLYVPGINFTGGSRPILQISNGQLSNWFLPQNATYRTQFGTATDPAANAPLIPSEATIYTNANDTLVYSENWTAPTQWTGNSGLVGSYRYPSVSDKSIYDWTKTNINQVNFGVDKNKTYNVELEQELLSNLVFSGGWYRQDFNSLSSDTLAQSNSSALLVDTNQKLPDGTVNPYFGQPYVTDTGADRFINTERNDNYRAMLAFLPDFTTHHGWTRWLGRYQMLGLYSSQHDMKALIRRHLYFTDTNEVQNGTIRWLKNPNPNLDGSPTGYNFENTDQTRYYYLSTPGHQPYGTVTQASGKWDASSFTGNILTYNYGTHQWERVKGTQQYIDSSASTGRSYRQVESISVGTTAYYWKDRLVITGGVRRDEYKARSTTTGVLLDQNNVQIAPAMTSQQKWVNGIFQTDTVFNRWSRWNSLSATTETLGGVFKPFQGYSSISESAQNGSLYWQFVQSLGFSYNVSNNFNPPSSDQVDAFGNPLPKPSGKGKDWGVQFSLFQGKLFARLNWFQSTNYNERAGNAFGRYTLIDDGDFKQWARTIAEINMGMDPTASGFGTNLSQAQEDAVQAATAKIYGLPYLYYQTLPSLGTTRTNVAKGAEVQLTYNPTRQWTMKVTGGQQKTVYSNVLKEFDAWDAYRHPIWTAAKAANFLLPQYKNLATYTASGGKQVDLTNFLTSYGYSGAPALGDALGVDNVQKSYDSLVTPAYRIARDLQGQVAPGQRLYRAAYLTNYNFSQGWLKGFGLGGSLRWESKAVIGYYGQSSGANANPLFVDIANTNRPIYDHGNTYMDLWTSYTCKLLRDKVRMKVQLNVVDALESGHLQTVAVNYDGSRSGYRIVDPRQFILTTTFDF